VSGNVKAALAGAVGGCVIAVPLLLTVTATATAAHAGARAAKACRSGYAYAGIAGAGASRGAAATITPASLPTVRAGHVAAWVGVGGRGLGPRGTDVWLQAGLAAYPGRRVHLYYELMLPSGRRYVELGAPVSPGVRHRVAVHELPARPETWIVELDGRPASDPIHLPGSHAAWPAVATAENWTPAGQACNNRFAFRFESLRIDGGKQIRTVLTRPFRLVRTSAASFRAAA
jgi:hypothetical protein